ncbi:MAG: hypothetical protein IT462_17535 [Planctomycetes bacterium]|nr:hypothetical protein [Planctomycetota bacterium]
MRIKILRCLLVLAVTMAAGCTSNLINSSDGSATKTESFVPTVGVRERVEKYSDGSIKSRVTAYPDPNGVLLNHGIYVEFHPDGGNKKCEGLFADGVKVGWWYGWNAKGRQIWRRLFPEGRNGASEAMPPDQFENVPTLPKDHNQVEERKEVLEDGSTRTYHVKVTVSGDEILHGEEMIRSAKGWVVELKNWENGKQHGPSCEYHLEGGLWRQLHWQGGWKRGVEWTYYPGPSSKPMGIQHWIGDNLEGASLQWWPNGKVKSLEGYSVDRSEVVRVSFDEKGNLIR